MLEVSGLSASLSGRPILHDITLKAAPGTVTAIVGPNGSGKTTLLRALTGDLPYQGAARLNGLEVQGTPARRMAAIRAVLSQATELAFPFTVDEVVRLGLTAGVQGAGVPRGGPDLPARALERVGLAGYGGRDVQRLSGGEQARVHLARVLVQVWEPVTDQGPRWLFLDEPVAALDIGHQLTVMGLARAYADAGGGVVAVMHDLNLSAMFADHIALLLDGRMLAQGAPAEVLTDAHLSRAYGCAVRVNAAPARGPWLVPQAMAV
ncbi:MAG: heme ABC transporter ATP-binding protein [Paracoccaceae bacterium]|nr:heme ABC transporter ATP-binding protein [Paracoccaceae bacterium]